MPSAALYRVQSYSCTDLMMGRTVPIWLPHLESLLESHSWPLWQWFTEKGATSLQGTCAVGWLHICLPFHILSSASCSKLFLTNIGWKIPLATLYKQALGKGVGEMGRDRTPYAQQHARVLSQRLGAHLDFHYAHTGLCSGNITISYLPHS